MELDMVISFVRLDEKFFKLIPGLGDDLVFIDIEVGSKHSLALTQDFQVFAWAKRKIRALDSLVMITRAFLPRSWSFLKG